MSEDYYREAAIRLWNLLDDIDTTDDIAKDSDLIFREIARLKTKARHDIFVSDGHNLFIPDVAGGEKVTDDG